VKTVYWSAKGGSFRGPTFRAQIIIEKTREFNSESHLVFTGYEKALHSQKYDLFSIPQEKKNIRNDL